MEATWPGCAFWGKAAHSLRALASPSQAGRLLASPSCSVEHHPIYLRRLPKTFDGFRIVHLSDIHHSPFTSREQIERAVHAANRLQPDIIALTGDYISHERQFAAPCAELLGRLRAQHGVFAVLGNHDHWTDAALITDLFRAEGITVLINQECVLSNAESLWLAGVMTRWWVEDLPWLAGSLDDE